MATVTRDVERPAFLDRRDEGQLTFDAATAPTGRRARITETLPLSERLRAERVAVGAPEARTGTATRGGGATLDELLVGAWEGLSSHHLVACPVCTAEMAPRAHAPGGACGDCGSQLR